MSKIELLELLQQDIEDIKGLMNYEKYELTEEILKNQARAIILNLEDHLEDFIKLNNKKQKPIKKLKNHLNIK